MVDLTIKTESNILKNKNQRDKGKTLPDSKKQINPKSEKSIDIINIQKIISVTETIKKGCLDLLRKKTE